MGSNLQSCKDAGQKLEEQWYFDCEQEKEANKSSMGEALTDIQEYHDMCAYQFELGYNLGMVQAWVAHFVTPLKCTYYNYD
jgi:hypothetical protein